MAVSQQLQQAITKDNPAGLTGADLANFNLWRRYSRTGNITRGEAMALDSLGLIDRSGFVPSNPYGIAKSGTYEDWLQRLEGVGSADPKSHGGIVKDTSKKTVTTEQTEAIVSGADKQTAAKIRAQRADRDRKQIQRALRANEFIEYSNVTGETRIKQRSRVASQSYRADQFRKATRASQREALARSTSRQMYQNLVGQQQAQRQPTKQQKPNTPKYDAFAGTSGQLLSKTNKSVTEGKQTANLSLNKNFDLPPVQGAEWLPQYYKEPSKETINFNIPQPRVATRSMLLPTQEINKDTNILDLAQNRLTRFAAKQEYQTGILPNVKGGLATAGIFAVGALSTIDKPLETTARSISSVVEVAKDPFSVGVNIGETARKNAGAFAVSAALNVAIFRQPFKAGVRGVSRASRAGLGVFEDYVTAPILERNRLKALNLMEGLIKTQKSDLLKLRLETGKSFTNTRLNINRIDRLKAKIKLDENLLYSSKEGTRVRQPYGKLAQRKAFNEAVRTVPVDKDFNFKLQPNAIVDLVETNVIEVTPSGLASKQTIPVLGFTEETQVTLTGKPISQTELRRRTAALRERGISKEIEYSSLQPFQEDITATGQQKLYGDNIAFITREGKLLEINKRFQSSTPPYNFDFDLPLPKRLKGQPPQPFSKTELPLLGFVSDLELRKKIAKGSIKPKYLIPEGNLNLLGKIQQRLAIKRGKNLLGQKPLNVFSPINLDVNSKKIRLDIIKKIDQGQSRFFTFTEVRKYTGIQRGQFGLLKKTTQTELPYTIQGLFKDRKVKKAKPLIIKPKTLAVLKMNIKEKLSKLSKNKRGSSQGLVSLTIPKETTKPVSILQYEQPKPQRRTILIKDRDLPKTSTITSSNVRSTGLNKLLLKGKSDTINLPRSKDIIKTNTRSRLSLNLGVKSNQIIKSKAIPKFRVNSRLNLGTEQLGQTDLLSGRSFRQTIKSKQAINFRAEQKTQQDIIQLPKVLPKLAKPNRPLLKKPVTELIRAKPKIPAPFIPQLELQPKSTRKQPTTGGRGFVFGLKEFKTLTPRELVLGSSTKRGRKKMAKRKKGRRKSRR